MLVRQEKRDVEQPIGMQKFRDDFKNTDINLVAFKS